MSSKCSSNIVSSLSCMIVGDREADGAGFCVSAKCSVSRLASVCDDLGDTVAKTKGKCAAFLCARPAAFSNHTCSL